MPFVRITVLAPTLTPAQLRLLEEGTTERIVAVMRKPIEGTAVLVERVSGGWSIAGRPVAVAAQVDITIGADTNTADEKARFMAEMWQLLWTALGPELREESYIVFHEIDPRSYGRGGLTRAERDRRRAAVPV